MHGMDEKQTYKRNFVMINYVQNKNKKLCYSYKDKTKKMLVNEQVVCSNAI